MAQVMHRHLDPVARHFGLAEVVNETTNFGVLVAWAKEPSALVVSWDSVEHVLNVDFRRVKDGAIDWVSAPLQWNAIVTVRGAADHRIEAKHVVDLDPAGANALFDRLSDDLVVYGLDLLAGDWTISPVIQHWNDSGEWRDSLPD